MSAENLGYKQFFMQAILIVLGALATASIPMLSGYTLAKKDTIFFAKIHLYDKITFEENILSDKEFYYNVYMMSFQNLGGSDIINKKISLRVKNADLIFKAGADDAIVSLTKNESEGVVILDIQRMTPDSYFIVGVKNKRDEKPEITSAISMDGNLDILAGRRDSLNRYFKTKWHTFFIVSILAILIFYILNIGLNRALRPRFVLADELK